MSTLLFERLSVYKNPNTARLNVWIYWEGIDNEISAYLQLCVEVLNVECFDACIHLVTPDNINQYLPGQKIRCLLDNIEMSDKSKVSIALKTDYLRVKLLYEYGGLWQDIDCIPLTDYGETVFPLLEKYDFLAMRKTSKKIPYVSNGFIASRKGGQVVSEYLSTMEAHIKRKAANSECYEWVELGSRMLTPIVDKYSAKVYFFEEQNIHPFDFTEHELLEKSGDKNLLADRLSESTLCIMLYNSLFSEHLKSATRAEVLASESLMAVALREALGEELASDAWLSRMEARNHWKGLVENDLLWCERYNLFYAACSKNGSSTIKRYLAEQCGGMKDDQASPHDRKNTGLLGLRDIAIDEAERLVKGDEVLRVAFVRNPFDRIISCYENRVAQLGLEEYDNQEYSTRAFRANRAKILAWKNGIEVEEVNDSETISFADFVEFVCQQDPYDMDRHWYFQSRSIQFDKIHYHFIGRVESLEKDLRSLVRLIGLEGEKRLAIPKLNLSKRGSDLRRYFDYRLEKLFVDCFIEDFLNFGYRPAIN